MVCLERNGCCIPTVKKLQKTRITMKEKTKKAFNPNDFFSVKRVEDVANTFEQLKKLDYKEVNLADEITKYNYEITSKEYKAFEFSEIEAYYEFEVDTIV
jgi:hypothetical protein